MPTITVEFDESDAPFTLVILPAYTVGGPEEPDPGEEADTTPAPISLRAVGE